MLSEIEFTLPHSNDAQRLFHGRGHCYPGLEHINIDWFAPVALITLYKEAPQIELQALAQQLSEKIDECQSVQVQYRYLKNAPYEVLKGIQVEQTVVQEQGRKYHIHLGKAQNSGLFLDIAPTRSWVQQHSQAANVLNLFAYTCAFSIAAIEGGAKQVVNIDMSKASLAKGRDNHRLNHHDLSKVKFEGVDIFKSFGRIKKHGPYDLLICDPPSFQKGSVDIAKDYKKIIRRIPEFMKPGSSIILCLNSPSLDAEFLKETVKEHCPECEYIESINTPAVFREAYQGKGLKVLLFQYKL